MEAVRPSLERSTVDTTRPFRSVKEAIAVFGERFLVVSGQSGDSTLHHQKPVYNVSPAAPRNHNPNLSSVVSSTPSYSSYSSLSNHDLEEQTVIVSSLKRLEAEIEETKRELTQLKKRESETEVVVASVKAELYKSVSRLAELEVAGVKAVKVEKCCDIEELETDTIASEQWREEGGKGDLTTGLKYLPSLAQVLSLGEMGGGYGVGEKRKVVKKKKPIMPLIGDFFSRKKGSSDDLGDYDSLYTRSFY